MQLFLGSGIFGGQSAFRIHNGAKFLTTFGHCCYDWLWKPMILLKYCVILCYTVCLFSVRQVVSRYITNYIVPTLKALLIHAKSSLCYVFPIAKSLFLPLCYVMEKNYPDRNSSKHSWIQKWSKSRIKNVIK